MSCFNQALAFGEGERHNFFFFNRRHLNSAYRVAVAPLLPLTVSENAVHDGSPLAEAVSAACKRGGSPIPFDRVLGVRCGAKAIDLIEEGKFGDTVALNRIDMVSMPIEEAVRTLHLVDDKNQLVNTAREIGISFGDGYVLPGIQSEG